MKHIRTVKQNGISKRSKFGSQAMGNRIGRGIEADENERFQYWMRSNNVSIIEYILEEADTSGWL